MTWYNRIFARLGNRRLFTKREFVGQMLVEAARPNSPVVVLRKDHYEQMFEILALANIINDCKRRRKRVSARIYDRLSAALSAYRNTPPSAIKMREEHLMDIPHHDA